MFDCSLISKFVGCSDKMFRWEVTITRGERSFTTAYGMGYAHCKRVDSATEGRVYVPMTVELLHDMTLPVRGAIGAAVAGGVEPNEPTARDVLESLQLDARAGAGSFEDFCSDLGYDSDSRKAEKIWEACRDTRDRLREFFGADFDFAMELAIEETRAHREGR